MQRPKCSVDRCDKVATFHIRESVSNWKQVHYCWKHMPRGPKPEHETILFEKFDRARFNICANGERPQNFDSQIPHEVVGIANLDAKQAFEMFGVIFAQREGLIVVFPEESFTFNWADSIMFVFHRDFDVQVAPEQSLIGLLQFN